MDEVDGLDTRLQRQEACGPPSIPNPPLPRNGRNDMRRHNIFLSNELQSYAVPGTAYKAPHIPHIRHRIGTPASRVGMGAEQPRSGDRT